ncbi:MAG: phosphoribosyltransferase [Patescibacteria group bacterium]|nr:MAG: phosphoribosyltransferase [Patescibacteria group bacterium]
MFKDRQDAGKKLAAKLTSYKGNPKAIVLGLPRGGVVVSHEIAEALGLPMDILVPRKISVPDNPEFAIGAVTENGEAVFDERALGLYGITQEYIDEEVEKEKKESARRLKTYRGSRTPLDLHGKIAVIVDDGVATGATMRAAILSAKAGGAEKITVAVPVIARDSLALIQKEVDEVVYIAAPLLFGAVGTFYDEFPQTDDEEVIALMRSAV